MVRKPPFGFWWWKTYNIYVQDRFLYIFLLWKRHFSTLDEQNNYPCILLWLVHSLLWPGFNTTKQYTLWHKIFPSLTIRYQHIAENLYIFAHGTYHSLMQENILGLCYLWDRPFKFTLHFCWQYRLTKEKHAYRFF